MLLDGSVPRRCTLTNAKAVVLLMTSLLICVSVHYFWSFEKVTISFAPGGPREKWCTFTQNDLQQSVFFQEKLWPALDAAVGKLLPMGSLMVACVVMGVCMARGRHRGTADYRRWRQRYTLEPHGVEQLVWMCFNVSVTTVCLTVPLNAYLLLKDASAIAVTEDNWELHDVMETVGKQAEYCCFSLKILVYVASSSRFRRELCSVFHLGVK